MNRTLLLFAGLLLGSLAFGQNKPMQRPQTQTPTRGAGKPTSAKVQWNAERQEIVCGKNRYRLVFVKGETFKMGGTPEQGTTSQNEKPVHPATVKDFSIGQTEVPQWLWMAVMGYNPSRFIGANLPVEQVNWYDCQQFLSKLNAMTGRRFSLPTEAQWEYAARGGKQSKGYRYSGSDKADEVAWTYRNSNAKTHTVASKTPNELGLYDMSGNVIEWCQSHWSTSYNARPDTSHYTIRGGSFQHQTATARVSIRKSGAAPGRRKPHLGFRIVLQP